MKRKRRVKENLQIKKEQPSKIPKTNQTKSMIVTEEMLKEKLIIRKLFEKLPSDKMMSLSQVVEEVKKIGTTINDEKKLRSLCQKAMGVYCRLEVLEKTLTKEPYYYLSKNFQKRILKKKEEIKKDRKILGITEQNSKNETMDISQEEAVLRILKNEPLGKVEIYQTLKYKEEYEVYKFTDVKVLKRNALFKILEKLETEGKLTKREENRKTYYSLKGWEEKKIIDNPIGSIKEIRGVKYRVISPEQNELLTNFLYGNNGIGDNSLIPEIKKEKK